MGLVIGSFIMTTCLIMHHVWCSFFWWNIKSLSWLSPATAQCPVTSGFSQNLNHLWKGKDFRWWDSRKYTHDRAADGDSNKGFCRIIWTGKRCWENCVKRSQGAYFEGDWGVIVLCIVFLLSYIFFNKCLYFSRYWLGAFWRDLVLFSKNALSMPIFLLLKPQKLTTANKIKSKFLDIQ